MKTYIAKITDYSQADYTEMYSLLECAIRDKIDAKKNEKSKKQSILGYTLLRKGIYEIYQKKELKITFNENGKPECDFCFFSISHSENMVVCVIFDQPIGIDVQKISSIKQREKYKFFTAKESVYVNQNPDVLNKKFIEIFSKKEAVIKMLGLSFSDSKSIDTFSDEFNFKTEIIDEYFVAICTTKF